MSLENTRRDFLRNLFTGGATAAATPPSAFFKEQCPPELRQAEAPLVANRAPTSYTVEDAADCITEILSHSSLATQIVYAARATCMAQAILRALSGYDRLFERELSAADHAALRLDEQVLPLSLHLAVALSLSGTLNDSYGAHRAKPLETDTRIMHAARITALGIAIKGGLALPIYAPRSGATFDHTEYSPDSAYFAYRLNDEAPSEEWIKKCCRQAIRSGMDPSFSGLFRDVLLERVALITTLSARAKDPNITLSLLADPHSFYSFFSLEEEDTIKWENVLTAHGGTLGLAVNLPLCLDAIKAFEEKYVPSTSLTGRIINAVLSPSRDNLEWLEALPQFKDLREIQKILALIPNSSHPPIEVLFRHGRRFNAAVASLEQANFPRALMLSPLDGHRYNDEITSLQTFFATILENLSRPNTTRELMERPQRDHLPPLPTATVLSETNLTPPQQVVVDGEVPIPAVRLRDIALRYHDGRTSLWRHTTSEAGSVYVEEVHIEQDNEQDNVAKSRTGALL